MNTDKENEWKAEARKAWNDSRSQDNEGGVDSVGFIYGYIYACRARQSEIDEASKEKKTYIELLDYLSSRNLVVENKKLKAELEKARELIRDILKYETICSPDRYLLANEFLNKDKE